MEEIDILGASAATLSMVFELIHSQYDSEQLTIRIIKNTDHVLDHPFALEGSKYQIIEDPRDLVISKNVVLGVYKSATKAVVYDYFNDDNDLKGKWISLIHATCAIAQSAKLGLGIQVNPLTTIAPFAEIADFVSINRNVSIGHHSRIGKFSTINPGVHIAGHCVIGEGTTIGMGALVLDGKQIGDHSVVAAGAVVTKDIPDRVLVMGVPAKIVKEL